MSRVIVLLSSLLLWAHASVTWSAEAQGGKPDAMDPVACTALLSPANAARFAQITDAVTTINSAMVVPAGGRQTVVDRDLPEICRVEGYIAPTVGFLLRMPTRDWNGKFMMGGCGGPCGNYLEDRIDPALVRGYAVVTTDMGHKGSGWQWAFNNLQGQIDFAYRATHLTAVVAKQIISTYYPHAATHNYYFGCSTGGRQGMIEAQRFPEDFEGIVAGAPVYDEVGDSPYFLDWMGISNTGADRRPILTQEKLQLVHRAVLAACDAADGLEDGIVQDPGRCHWDPHSLVCRGEDRPECLTGAQAEVVRKVYTGATDSKGSPLYYGMPRGSENQWAFWIQPRENRGVSITAYMGFSPSAPPTWSVYDFDYERDPARTRLTGTLFNPTNPDLSAFRQRGGKLILFHGYDDNNIPVGASIAYYETALSTLGGHPGTDSFFRFFTPPGVNHCRGGDGGGSIDWISALENWVEHAQPPEVLTAYHLIQPYPGVKRDLTDYGTTYLRLERFPLQKDEYDRARPLYPFPAIARYKGKGDPALPSSYIRSVEH